MGNIKSIKIWITIFFLPLFWAVILPAIKVWRVDVNMQWNHPFHPDGYYIGFNERRQKTNYLASHAPLPIDTLFLGSSRTAYINPEWTGTEYGFNYGVSSGNYKDYEKYLAFAQNCSSKEIKNVWIELSFFQVLDTDNVGLDNVDACIRDAGSFDNKLANVFSHDAVKLTKTSLLPFDTDAMSTDEMRKLSDAYIMYDGILQSYSAKDKFYISSDEKKDEIARQLKVYDDIGFYKQPYDEECAGRLKSLALALKGKNCIVYIPPVTSAYLKQEADYGQLMNHERFLREAVEAFGEVWDFAYPNEITSDENNFQDAHHAKHVFLQEMIGIIKKREFADKNKYLVTRDNIDKHLQYFSKKMLYIYLNP